MINRVKILWIDDSSCVIKFCNPEEAKLAYNQKKLTEPRDDDRLPPLDIFLRELKDKEKLEKVQNPTYETLFGDG